MMNIKISRLIEMLVTIVEKSVLHLTKVKVKVHTLDIAPLRSESPLHATTVCR